LGWDAAVDTETEQPGYVPPERAQETPAAIDAQSDIWAVGAVMFRLLSGRAVRGRGTGTRLDFGAAMRLPAPSLASVAPETSPELAAIVDKALALDKAARWPDAASMQRALEKLAPRVLDRPTMRTLDFSPSKMPSLRFQIATVEPPKERRRAHLALILLGVVVCATLSYQLVRRVVARDAAPSARPAAAHDTSTAPALPREVDLPSEAVEPAPSALPEPVPLTHPRHRRHGASNGASPPDDAPEAPEPSASSMLDRRH
jgi:serine/threonine-protein kinase